jgi:hypothetical protein
VQLGDRISADLSGNAVMIGNALGAILETSTNCSGLMIHFADDEDRTDDS